MGRQSVFRQLTKERTDSLAAKTTLHGLISLVKTHCEIAWPEAELLGSTLFDFFVDNSAERTEGQIIYGARWTPDYCYRQAKPLEEPVRVRLTVFHPYDVELWRETGGIKAVQASRLIRLMEEAYRQGGVLSLGDLALLTATSAKTIRETLKPMWAAGLMLPIMGMVKKFSRHMQDSRGEAAIRRYLAGEDVQTIREELFISTSHWRSILQTARAEIMAGREGGYLRIWQEAPDSERKEYLIEPEDRVIGKAPQSREELFRDLETRFGMSPAAAGLLVQTVEEWLKPGLGAERGDGQVVYHAVADYEPPGKALTECDLIPVTLDYLAEEDKEGFDQDAPKQLIWKRIVRLAGQAHAQGASLNQPDLAHILGISPDMIQHLLKANKEVFVPTRGNLADIGPGVSHARKIIELYLQGYTETEIQQRTHHTYESIENYLDRFCKVVGLRDDGLSAAEIRIALGCSYRTVKEYLALVEEFDTEEYRWMMTQIRNRYQRKKALSPKGGMPL